MRKFIIGIAAAAMLAVPAGAMANEGGQTTTGPEAGHGCFGQWRAGSVQAINDAAAPGDNAGNLYFSVRKGNNADMNADAKALCASL